MYAGIFRRSVATLIDIAVLVAFIAYVMGHPLIAGWPWANFAVAIAVVLLYEPVLSSRLCTLGQALMATRIRRAETLDRLSIGASYKRFALKYVASILGAASAGVANAPMGAGGVRVSVWPHGDHRSIHDMQVGSVVVNARTTQGFAFPVAMTLLIVGALNSNLVAAQSANPISDCPVTLPSESPVQGAPASDGPGWSHAWYGSPRLAALLPENGHWVGMGAERNYSDKFWWWRSGYNAFEEPMPDLVISASLLDGSGPEVEIAGATSAFGGGGHSMLVGMEFPSAGCWKVRGAYKGAEELVFVLQVRGR